MSSMFNFKQKLTPKVLTKLGFSYKQDEFTGGMVWVKDKYDVPHTTFQGDRFIYLPEQYKCMYLNHVTYNNVKSRQDLELIIESDKKYSKQINEVLKTTKPNVRKD